LPESFVSAKTSRMKNFTPVAGVWPTIRDTTSWRRTD